MRSIWKFFASVKLTIALAGAICLVAAWGSLLTVENSRYFRAIDQEVLFPWLASVGVKNPGLTAWIFILIALTAFFGINTAVCTTDRVVSIVRQGLPKKALFPHIVHIGFLIAVLGHLVSSASGWRSYGNVLIEGEPVAVPGMENTSVRLDGVDVRLSERGEPDYIGTTITILEGSREARTDVIEINGPVIHRGVAFYHLDYGETPSALVLDIDGEEVIAPTEGIFESGEETFRFGRLFPDFALDPSGNPVTRSMNYINPHIEVLSSSGGAGWLAVSSPGSRARVTGGEKDFLITLEDFIISSYAVVSIHKDPGIWLIIVGSAVLVVGMVLLLFFRGERGELIGQARRHERL